MGEDEDFTRGPRLSAVEFVNANEGIVSGFLRDINNFNKNGKLDQVVSIIKSCTPNVLGVLIVTIKDLSGSIHHKILKEGDYGKDITVGVALILHNISVFSRNPSLHYLNITLKKLVKVSTRIQFLEMTVV